MKSSRRTTPSNESPQTIEQASERLRSEGHRDRVRRSLSGLLYDRPDIAAAMDLKSLFYIYARADGENINIEYAGRRLLDEIKVALAAWRRAVRAQGKLQAASNVAD